MKSPTNNVLTQSDYEKKMKKINIIIHDLYFGLIDEDKVMEILESMGYSNWAIGHALTAMKNRDRLKWIQEYYKDEVDQYKELIKSKRNMATA